MKHIIKIFLALFLIVSFCINAPFAYAQADVSEATTDIVSSAPFSLSETEATQECTNASALSDEKTAVFGDVNGDGKLTLDDAKFVLSVASQHIAENKTADVNGDGVVSIDDVRLIIETINAPMADNAYRAYLSDLGFPKSYVDPLLKLYKKYPSWDFVPFITGLNWVDAVNGEHTPHKKQLIENNVSSSFMCDCSKCKGVIQEGSNWVSASKEAVEYYLDPRNFLTEQYIFQFETTNYSPSHSIEAVEIILEPTWMHDSVITYLDANGKTQTYLENGQPVKYSQAIMKAAKDSGMSAYYLASKIVQEVGSSTSSYAGGSSGKNAPYNGIYNYYNIGAYTGAGDGLRWANGYMKAKNDTTVYTTADGKGTAVVNVPKNTELNFISQQGNYYNVSVKVNGKTYSGYVSVADSAVSSSYGRPWDSPYKSIYYGAQYIYQSFSQLQFTGYLQKFNVNPASDNLYSHEYMANIRAAAAESKKTYNAYNESGVLKSNKVFSIPVFKNMPNADLSELDIFKGAKPEVTATANETTVTLKWKAIENAKYYQVFKYNSETQKYEILKAISSTEYTDTGYSSGDTVQYQVRGFYGDETNGYIYTSYSDTVRARTSPKMPTGFTVSNVKDNSVTLKWNEVSCDGYVIYRYSAISGYEKLCDIKSTEYIDKSVISGTNYLYRVCAYYNGGSMTAYSSQTERLSVTTTGEAQQTGVVKVNDVLNIRTEPNTSCLILTTAANGQTVRILEKSDGWYKVQFTADGTTYTGYASADYIVLK